MTLNAVSRGERATGGEYLRLVWKAEYTPLSSVTNIARLIENRLLDDPFIVAASPPSTAIPGQTVLSFGYVYAEAGVKLAAVANGKPYSEVLARLEGFGGIIKPNIILERIVRATHLHDRAGLAEEAAAADVNPVLAFGRTATTLAFLALGVYLYSQAPKRR